MEGTMLWPHMALSISLPPEGYTAYRRNARSCSRTWHIRGPDL